MYLSASAPHPSAPAARSRDARVALLAVPTEVEHVPRVRHFTVAVLRAWRLDEEACETAELVVAELAANAVQYGGGELSLHLSFAEGPGRLVVVVRDSGRAPLRRPGRDCDPCERGRGMEIVAYLAQWVHVEHHPGGRCVKACVLVPEAGADALPGLPADMASAAAVVV